MVVTNFVTWGKSDKFISFLLQLTAIDDEIFEAVVAQVDFPKGYTHTMLKQGMLTYMSKNADYFMVITLIVHIVIFSNVISSNH